MAFEPKKFNDLYESMRKRMDVHGVLTDFEVGSVARTMFESFAYELGILYQTMNAVYLSGFVDTAEGAHLDKVVAVLGIERSLPDYSVGEVTFTRDRSNFDIVIPIGTLVATEKRGENVKKGTSTDAATDASKSKEDQRKVYKTIEPAELLKNAIATTVTVKVQAIERGESMDAEKETIVVMPRPIVGIKSVKNENPVQLLGRQLETDEELRRRAKNALLSSGKGDAAAIENAVLALPEVRSVVVLEDKDNRGYIKVVVDAPNFKQTLVKTAIETAVTEVRAAGIFAEVVDATRLFIHGTITITAKQSVLTDSEKDALKRKASTLLKDFFKTLQMGQPLLLSQLMKAFSPMEDIEDIQCKVYLSGNLLEPRTVPQKTERYVTDEQLQIVINEPQK